MEDLKKIAEENEMKVITSLIEGPKGWKELRETTKLSERTLAKHIKRLIEKEVIEEKIDPKDRRRKIYYLKMDSETAINSISLDSLSILIAYSILKNIFKFPQEEEGYIEFLTWVGDVVLLGLIGTEESYEAILRALEIVFKVVRDYDECIDSELRLEIKKFWENFWNEWIAVVRKSLTESKKMRIPDSAKRFFSPTPSDPEMPINCLSALFQLIDKTAFKVIETLEE